MHSSCAKEAARESRRKSSLYYTHVEGGKIALRLSGGWRRSCPNLESLLLLGQRAWSIQPVNEAESSEESSLEPEESSELAIRHRLGSSPWRSSWAIALGHHYLSLCSRAFCKLSLCATQHWYGRRSTQPPGKLPPRGIALAEPVLVRSLRLRRVWRRPAGCWGLAVTARRGPAPRLHLHFASRRLRNGV